MMKSYKVTLHRHVDIWKGMIITALHSIYYTISGFPRGSMVKNPPANARGIRDVSTILRSGRTPEAENGNSLQYSYLEYFMDRGT